MFKMYLIFVITVLQVVQIYGGQKENQDIIVINAGSGIGAKTVVLTDSNRKKKGRNKIIVDGGQPHHFPMPFPMMGHGFHGLHRSASDEHGVPNGNNFHKRNGGFDPNFQFFNYFDQHRRQMIENHSYNHNQLDNPNGFGYHMPPSPQQPLQPLQPPFNPDIFRLQNYHNFMPNFFPY